MSTHSSSHSESNRKFTKSLLKQLARDFQSLSLRQLQHEAQNLEEKKERDAHLGILEEELKIVREKDECIRKLKKNLHMPLVIGRVTHMLRGVLE